MQFGQATAIGIAWYGRSDYERIREVMADGQNLPLTFDEWQSKAEHLEAQIRSAGKTPFRAYIDPEQFVRWCASAGRDVDAEARTRFAANPENWANKN